MADAQLALARSHGASSWTRLVQAVRLADALWRDDLETVRTLITGNPVLIQEHVLIRTDSGWGPPMTYAANLGRDRIIRLVYQHGAKDLESAAGRAALTPVHGTTLLHIAAYFDEMEIAEWLLDRGNAKAILLSTIKPWPIGMGCRPVVQLSSHLPRKTLPLSEIQELDEDWLGDDERATWQAMIEHMSWSNKPICHSR